MCWCTPNIRTPYCNSNVCQELKKRSQHLDKLEWKLSESLKEKEVALAYIKTMENRVKANAILIRNQARLLRNTEICGSCRNWRGAESICRLDKQTRCRKDRCNKFYPFEH